MTFPLPVKIRHELILINLLVLALVFIIIIIPNNIFRVFIGLPLVLFFPGYVFIAALMPRKTALDAIERIALSFVASLVAVLLIGLLLNYTPWGITVKSTLYSMASFILVMSIIAWVRRRKLGEAERFVIEFYLGLPKWGSSRWDKILIVTLLVTILVALGVMIYIVVVPKASEKFTEFYVLGEGGVADYPGELGVGEEAKFVIGIINNEREAISYQIVVKIDNEEISRWQPMVLSDGEKKETETEISFTPQTPGESRKITFLLYKQGQTDIYRSLHLWVNVKE